MTRNIVVPFVFRCESDCILGQFLLELLELKCPVTVFLETTSLWLTNLSPAVYHGKSMSVQQLTGTAALTTWNLLFYYFIGRNGIWPRESKEKVPPYVDICPGTVAAIFGFYCHQAFIQMIIFFQTVFFINFYLYLKMIYWTFLTRQHSVFIGKFL